MDINTHEIPPQGWQWFEACTGWKLPTPVSSTHDQSVTLIIRHRMANPAMVAKHNLPTDFATVSQQLINYQRKRLGIPPPPKPSPQQFNFGQLAAVGSGVRTLADWLGGGGVPVSQELADKRARICAGDPNDPTTKCPKNDAGDWLSTFTIPAQNLIRRQLQERKDLKLATPYDDKLQMCNACACPLPLKVHVPIVYINQRIPPPIREKLDPRCWILHESA